MTLVTSARNATLEDMKDVLLEQHARKVDVVVPATMFRSRNGLIEVSPEAAEITDEGVTTAEGVYRPTAVFDEGIADKLKIPLAYVRWMRQFRPDLYDANVNGLLHGRHRVRGGEQEVLFPEDPRSFMLRLFRPDEGHEVGIARSLLSDSYKVMDNLDVLVAVLSAIKDAGLEIEVRGADLSDRRMYVRIVAPQVRSYARRLLDGYRSYDGRTADDFPLVFAGLVVSNSETGDGAFSIGPRAEIQVCTNGMTWASDVIRNVHLGGKLEPGVIKWSEETHRKNVELVTAKTKDAVSAFLSEEYLKDLVYRVEEKAGIALHRPSDQVRLIGKKLAFDDATIEGVFEHFVSGGQATAGGLMQAVTSFAQTVPDPDLAFEMEEKATRVLELAATVARD